MADFHLKDTLGFNYKIGGSASGIYNLPISKLFAVRDISVVTSTVSISGESTYTAPQVYVDDITLNNATYTPIGIVGSYGSYDGYLNIEDLTLNGDNNIVLAVRNPTSTSRNFINYKVKVLFVCAKVPWLQV